MIEFDFENVELTEFGVGREVNDDPQFVTIPVDADVQDALLEMAQVTQRLLQSYENDAEQYQPSEKHGSKEYLFVPSDSGLDSVIRLLHEAHNIQIDAGALNDPSKIYCYFARFTDGQMRRLTALRRAAQFKGVLKSKVLQFSDDSLRIVEDKIFKLDSDFDLLIDSESTHILRPSAFESICEMKQLILDAVPENIALIRDDVSYIDWENIQIYASKHSRAARYLASIRNQNLAGITRDALVSFCRTTGIELEEVDNEVFKVADGHFMGFLEVLDRRRYRVDFIQDAPEQFRATSRRRIDS